jgi:hypothetical protein
MNVIPGSRGWETAALYIATLHGGYPDGALMIGRSMPSPETATRVACGNVNAPQRIDVPLTSLTTKAGVRAADQTHFICHSCGVLMAVTVPVADAFIGVRRTATEPRLAHVPLRTWTL